MKIWIPIAVGCLFALAAPVFAQMPVTPAITGLGTAHPATTDISLSSRYHVYRFERDGVTYIQINGANDTPRLAFATASGITLPLPIGSDRLAMDATSAVHGELVYCDDTLELFAPTPDAEGAPWQMHSLNKPRYSIFDGGDRGGGHQY